MTNDLMPFTSLAEMRDAVLGALPPGPEIVELASPGEKRQHELLVRSVEEIRQGRSFAFDSFDFNADASWKIAEQGERAFAAGLLGLPHPVFAGLTTLIAKGIPALAIIMAEEVPQAEHRLPIDTPVLRVGGVLPMRQKDGYVLFDWISRTVLVATVKGSVANITEERSIDTREAMRSTGPPFTLFAMLTMLADDRVEVRRTVAPVYVNDERARRRFPPIPPMWTVSGVDLSELCSRTVRPKQPRG